MGKIYGKSKRCSARRKCSLNRAIRFQYCGRSWIKQCTVEMIILSFHSPCRYLFEPNHTLKENVWIFFIYVSSERFILHLENVSKNRNISNIKSPFFLLIEILRPNFWVVHLKILYSFRFTTASWTSNTTKGLVTNTFTAVAKIYRYNISFMPEAWRRGLGWSITCFVSPIKEDFWRQQMTFAFFLQKLNLSSTCLYYLF